MSAQPFSISFLILLCMVDLLFKSSLQGFKTIGKRICMFS